MRNDEGKEFWEWYSRLMPLKFDTRLEAYEFLADANALIAKFGWVSVGDLADMLHYPIECSSMYEYGWKNLSATRVISLDNKEDCEIVFDAPEKNESFNGVRTKCKSFIKNLTSNDTKSKIKRAARCIEGFFATIGGAVFIGLLTGRTHLNLVFHKKL